MGLSIPGASPASTSAGPCAVVMLEYEAFLGGAGEPGPSEGFIDILRSFRPHSL